MAPRCTSGQSCGSGLPQLLAPPAGVPGVFGQGGCTAGADPDLKLRSKAGCGNLPPPQTSCGCSGVVMLQGWHPAPRVSWNPGMVLVGRN